MKNLKLILFTLFLFIIMSCEDNTPKPDCEVNHYGTVQIINKSPNPLYVDVTKNRLGYNDVQYLPVFQSTEYHMSPGTIYLYSASPSNYANNLWVERTNSIEQCGSLHFTWTSGSKSVEIIIDENNNFSVYDENSKDMVTRPKN